MSALLSFLLLIAALSTAHAQFFDGTREPGAAGSNVVFATVSLIDSSGLFPNQNRFLRRLAYVESRDGVDINTFRPGYFGGIWQIDEALFNITKDTTARPELFELYLDILDEFNVDWTLATWQDLTAPIFSALAASIYLTTIGEPVPPVGDLVNQGVFWLDHFLPDNGDTVQFFIESVDEFELEECPIRGLDLAFVFDSSGSVGRTNFDKERQFAVAVTNTFNVGPDNTRVANVVYSGIVRVNFLLNQFSNRSDVTDALATAEYFNIENPPGSRRGTNTAAALTVLREMVFNETYGARQRSLGIPRVAVVITDGRSNVNSQNTIPAAESLRDDGVQVFGVGVGSRINLDEVKAISSGPDFLILLDSFSDDQFANLRRTLISEACILPAPIEIEAEIEGTLFLGDFSFFQFQIPTDGLTLSLEGETGKSVMYASDKIMNPNEAFHDYRYESDQRGGLYVSLEQLGGRGKRAEFTDSTLYVTVEGLQQENQFKLITTFGNTSASVRLMSGLCTVILLLLTALLL